MNQTDSCQDGDVASVWPRTHEHNITFGRLYFNSEVHYLNIYVRVVFIDNLTHSDYHLQRLFKRTCVVLRAGRLNVTDCCSPAPDNVHFLLTVAEKKR